jgi:hypothetical protein
MDVIVLSRLNLEERDNLETGAAFYVQDLIRQYKTVYVTGENDFEKIFDHQARTLKAIFSYTAEAWPLLESERLVSVFLDKFAEFENKLKGEKYNKDCSQDIKTAMSRLRRVISLKSRSTYVTRSVYDAAMKCISTV